MLRNYLCIISTPVSTSHLGVDYTCVLDVQFECVFTVACVFNVIFNFLTLEMTVKTHSTEKRTYKLLIQKASVIYPL
jgi:hypothetical protein